MLTVTKIFHFEAAHSLPDYKGACHNLHGHSYKLEVRVSGDIQAEGEKRGMIIDFKDIKSIVNDKIVSKLDHAYLNDTYPNPTAEVMIRDIGVKLYLEFNKMGIELQSVRLWETADSCAEYTPEFDDNLGKMFIIE